MKKKKSNDTFFVSSEIPLYKTYILCYPPTITSFGAEWFEEKSNTNHNNQFEYEIKTNNKNTKYINFYTKLYHTNCD